MDVKPERQRVRRQFAKVTDSSVRYKNCLQEGYDRSTHTHTHTPLYSTESRNKMTKDQILLSLLAEGQITSSLEDPVRVTPLHAEHPL